MQKLTKNEKLTLAYALVCYRLSLKGKPWEKQQYKIVKFHRKNVDSIRTKLGLI